MVASPLSQICEVSLVPRLVVKGYCIHGVVSPGDDHLIIVRICNSAGIPVRDKLNKGNIIYLVD